MKIIFLIIVLSLLSSPLFSNEPEKAELQQDGSLTVSCSDLQDVGYRGNSDSNPYVVQFTAAGRRFIKRFFQLNGLERASHFVKDLKNCSKFSFSYNVQSYEIGEFVLLF